MICPKCGMEMLRIRVGEWACPNKACPEKVKGGEGK